jgi:hypothetical protein
MARGGFLDAAYQILTEAGEPMHGLEIVRIGLDRALFTTSAKDHRTLVNSLYSEVQRSRNRRGFTVLGNGYFGLREWDGGSPQPVTQTAQRRGRTARSTSSNPSGVTMEMLELTRQSMPADQFRQVWGPIYDQLVSEERARAITPISDKQLLQAVRQPVRRIQDFLQGRGNDTPKSEDVCDWVQLCYTLGLYREGAALWQYVQRDEVNAWLYERSKKIAAVCRTRIGA